MLPLSRGLVLGRAVDKQSWEIVVKLRVALVYSAVQLYEMFEVAEHWKALLLLDEADEFLRQRSLDPNHKTLVSFFFSRARVLPSN